MIKLSLIPYLFLLWISCYSNSEYRNDPYLADIDIEQIHEAIPSIQMYYFIKKYSKEYNIPESYAFSMAYQETTYRGPLDIEYIHYRRSIAGALGPMQIMPLTAKHVLGYSVSKHELNNNIDLNVRISMKLLRELHDKYQNWYKVFGAYNTGKPIINSYSKRVVQNKYVWVTE